jgi:Tol biopolymer transport system component
LIISLIRREKSFLTFLGSQNKDNRQAKFSPDGTKIVIWSNNYLWQMDTTGQNLHQRTTYEVDVNIGVPFSWSIIGNKIIYTRYQSKDWTMKNGVLWMLDINTKSETQITFNP